MGRTGKQLVPGCLPVLLLLSCSPVFSNQRAKIMAVYKKQLTPEQALQKLKHYCGYQERCHNDVKEKLYNLGVRKSEHDAIMATLIEQGYLNEERFAIAFAGGKFRVNHWGRIKIKYGLKQKQVSDYCIRKALKQISEADYLSLLKKAG
jgi:regulatory protein